MYWAGASGKAGKAERGRGLEGIRGFGVRVPHLIGSLEVHVVKTGVAEEDELDALAGKDAYDLLVGLVVDKEANSVAPVKARPSADRNASPRGWCGWRGAHPAAREVVSAERGTGRHLTLSWPR